MNSATPTPDEPRLRAVFLAALDRAAGKERSAYLDRICAGDENLRRRVEALLARHSEETLLAAPALVPSGATLPPGEEPGSRVGRYKLLEKLGEGGFGVVWMAEQEEPVRRRVALKIIKLGMDTREVVARFEGERQALALMDHPGIARVFDGGATERGRPFFVMELVRGTTITEYCEQHRLEIRDRLELFVQVCEAVQHAHQKGVIHRDLKPSNVLVTDVDGRLQPKVIDFGVAKATAARLTTRTVFTRLQQVIGTPAYMSPEQAGGAPEDVDTRSDIYALGVLLYELLTGRTPFDTKALLAAGFDAILRVIREVEPPLPSTRLSSLTVEQLTEVAGRRRSSPERLGRLVRGELDWVVMRALEKDRQRRYPTAQGLAADLGHYLRDEPVNAAPPSVGYRLAKFVRRNRATVGTGIAIGLTLLVATAVSLRLAVIARNARDAASAERDRAVVAEREADRQRDAAERNANESRERLVRLSVGNGELLAERGDVFGATVWYADALARDSGPKAAPAAHRARIEASLDNVPALVAMWFHDGLVRSGRFDPQGARVVTAGDDGTARLWETIGGKAVGAPIRHAGAVLDASFSDDGARVLTICEDNTARVWDAATGRPVSPPLVHRLPLKRASFAASGGVIVTASGRNASTVATNAPRVPARTESEIRAWDTVTGAEVRSVIWCGVDVRDLAVSAEGSWVAAAYADRNVMLWNSRTWWEFSLHRADDQPGKLGPAGAGTSSGAPAPTRASRPGMDRLAFFFNGRRLVAAFDDGGLEIWGLGDPPRTPPGLISTIQEERRPRPGAAEPSIVGSPDGAIVACLGSSGTVRFWNPTSAEVAGQTASQHAGAVGIAFSPDGGRIATFGGGTGMQGAVRVWDAATGQPVTPILPHGGPVTGVAFDPDGIRLLITGADGSVRLWDLAGTVSANNDVRIQQIAALAAARQLDESGSLVAFPVAAARERWEGVCDHDALLPAADPARRRAWLEREAGRAEANGQWFAAAHHLARIVAGRPDDEELRGRLARARTRAALGALERTQ